MENVLLLGDRALDPRLRILDHLDFPNSGMSQNNLSQITDFLTPPC